MLNKACMDSLSFTLYEIEVPPKNSDSDFSFAVEILLTIERFSYHLEKKTREQNRNNKRTEIERFDWFIERTDKRVWLLIG